MNSASNRWSEKRQDLCLAAAAILSLWACDIPSTSQRHCRTMGMGFIGWAHAASDPRTGAPVGPPYLCILLFGCCEVADSCRAGGGLSVAFLLPWLPSRRGALDRNAPACVPAKRAVQVPIHIEVSEDHHCPARLAC